MSTRTARKSYGVNRDGWTGLRDLLVGTPEEFNRDGQSLTGRTITDTSTVIDRRSQLPTEWRERLTIALSAHGVRYVIYSYHTPIAWQIDYHGVPFWVIPDVKYSITTSKHQGRVRTALFNTNEIRQEWLSGGDGWPSKRSR